MRGLRAPAPLLVFAIPLAMGAALLGCDAEGAGGVQRGEVRQVIDGDTLRVHMADGDRLVRLIGVDAPELHHPEAGEQYLGSEAQSFVAQRTSRSGVTLAFDEGQPRRDRFGRLLAYVGTEEGEDLGAVLLERGLARVLRRYSFARRERYLELERRAKEAGVGIWAAGGLAEVRWLLARRTPALRVLPMTGGRYAVLSDGRVRPGVSGRALSDALWAARRAQGLAPRDPAAARRILDEAGFVSVDTRPASR